MGTFVVSGFSRTMRFVCFVSCVSLVLILVAAPGALAGERYALVVTGASGGDNYAVKYDSWRNTFVDLRRRSRTAPAPASGPRAAASTGMPSSDDKPRVSSSRVARAVGDRLSTATCRNIGR